MRPLLQMRKHLKQYRYFALAPWCPSVFLAPLFSWVLKHSPYLNRMGVSPLFLFPQNHPQGWRAVGRGAVHCFAGRRPSGAMAGASGPDVSGPIGINPTKWDRMNRRGEGGEAWRGGPFGSPARSLDIWPSPLSTQRRATRKAPPSHPNHPRPYAPLGPLLRLMPIWPDVSRPWGGETLPAEITPRRTLCLICKKMNRTP